MSTHVVDTAKDLFSRTRRRLESWPPTAVLVDMADHTASHRAGDLAAVMAFYACFSIFPLLLGVIALLSLFLDPHAVQDRLIALTQDYFPGTQTFVASNIEGIVRFRGALGLASIAGLFWSGSAAFDAVSRAFNLAWRVRGLEPFYIAWLRRVLLALGVGVFFILSVGSTALFQLLGSLPPFDNATLETLRTIGLWGGLEISSAMASLIALVLLYQFATSDHIPWRDLWPGAILAGFLLELAKNAFVFYLHKLAHFDLVYGSVSSVIALLLWVYVSFFILILGAEFGASLGRKRRNKN